MLMLTHHCKQSFSKEIVIFSISFILFIVTSLIGISTFYRILQRHKSNQFPLPLFLAQIIFYIVSILYLISELFAQSMHCFMSDKSTLLQMMQISPGILYLIHWSSLLFILFCRLYYSFIGTVLALSKSYIYTFIIFLSILFLAVLTPMIFSNSLSDDTYFLSNTIFAIALFLAIIVSQYVSFTYIYKLLCLHIGDDKEMIEQMTKYTILTVIPVFGSTLTLISFIVVILNGATESAILFRLFTCLLNVSLDLFCLALSMKFHQNYYYKLCGWIDIKCANICSNLGNKRRIIRDESVKFSGKPSLEIVHTGTNTHSVVHSSKLSGSIAIISKAPVPVSPSSPSNVDNNEFEGP